jgi:hypothetical protein
MYEVGWCGDAFYTTGIWTWIREMFGLGLRIEGWVGLGEYIGLIVIVRVRSVNFSMGGEDRVWRVDDIFFFRKKGSCYWNLYALRWDVGMWCVNVWFSISKPWNVTLQKIPVV